MRHLAVLSNVNNATNDVKCEPHSFKKEIHCRPECKRPTSLHQSFLTQLSQWFLHVEVCVDTAGVRGQEGKVLTLRAVHLHIHSHSCQRLLSLKDRHQCRAIQ